MVLSAKKQQPADDFDSAPTRLYSLDALRGFDMFWIMGADEILYSMAHASKSPFWNTLAQQFTHPDWNGFHVYDLIFPLFLFMAGVSTPFSVGRELEKGKSREQLLLRVIKRTIILIVLGLVVNNGLKIQPFADIRFPSVLGRIGIAYMLANIIYLYAKEWALIFWFCFFIVGYYLLLKFTSAPGFAHGDLTPQGNFASYVDRTILPGKLYVPFPNTKISMHDPEGLFSTIPAISTGILGILAGLTLKKKTLSQNAKAVRLAVAGIVLLILAQIWNLDFPINKNLWSSSFVLHVGGLSLLLMSLFYYVIDVMGYKKWAFFFKVIGMNSILIYISGHFIKWNYTNNSFFGWIGQLAGDPYNAVIMAITFVLIKWVFLYYLYQKKTFLRV
ncbi:acyltransferase family protein [Mucilaginibacter sp.]|uniref:acyltransferase family protein n=1 Tax=Mucilaginibacter sp. TaxID=1882438 RepID=UPI003D0D0E89